jgi:hypothetical protein
VGAAPFGFKGAGFDFSFFDTTSLPHDQRNSATISLRHSPDGKVMMSLVMGSTSHIMKAGIATVVSLWMGVLACALGCQQQTLPAIPDASSLQENSAAHNQLRLMLNMESCHHSGGTSPAQPKDGKPDSNKGVSCCPLEITLIQKWDTTAPGIAPSHDFVSSSDFALLATGFSEPVEFAPPILCSGRDTLLQTHLLRI